MTKIKLSVRIHSELVAAIVCCLCCELVHIMPRPFQNKRLVWAYEYLIQCVTIKICVWCVSWFIITLCAKYGKAVREHWKKTKSRKRMKRSKTVRVRSPTFSYMRKWQNGKFTLFLGSYYVLLAFVLRSLDARMTTALLVMVLVA